MKKYYPLLALPADIFIVGTMAALVATCIFGNAWIFAL